MIKNCFCFALLAVVFVFAAAEAEAQNSGKVFWNGSVDNKLHLIIEGTTIEHRVMEGQATPDGDYSFTAPLPKSPVTVSVNKLDGRSKNIKVIQQPTAENGFKAIVEIFDEGGGARDYLLEIFW